MSDVSITHEKSSERQGREREQPERNSVCNHHKIKIGVIENKLLNRLAQIPNAIGKLHPKKSLSNFCPDCIQTLWINNPCRIHSNSET
nr:hypothetical protein [uncultured Ottowia sp.]